MDKTIYFFNVLTLSALSTLLIIEIALLLGYMVVIKYPVERYVEFPVLVSITVASMAYTAYRMWRELFREK